MARLFASLLIGSFCTSIVHGFPLPKQREPSYPESIAQDPRDRISIGMTQEMVELLLQEQVRGGYYSATVTLVPYYKSKVVVQYHHDRVISFHKMGSINDSAFSIGD
jgi:hypothetical protein